MGFFYSILNGTSINVFNNNLIYLKYPYTIHGGVSTIPGTHYYVEVPSSMYEKLKLYNDYILSLIVGVPVVDSDEIVPVSKRSSVSTTSWFINHTLLKNSILKRLKNELTPKFSSIDKYPHYTLKNWNTFLYNVNKSLEMAATYHDATYHDGSYRHYHLYQCYNILLNLYILSCMFESHQSIIESILVTHVSRILTKEFYDYSEKYSFYDLEFIEFIYSFRNDTTYESCVVSDPRWQSIMEEDKKKENWNINILNNITDVSVGEAIITDNGNFITDEEIEILLENPRYRRFMILEFHYRFKKEKINNLLIDPNIDEYVTRKLIRYADDESVLIKVLQKYGDDRLYQTNLVYSHPEIFECIKDKLSEFITEEVVKDIYKLS